MEVVMITGRPSGWVKVVHTNDGDMIADELSSRSLSNYTIKHREVLPVNVSFEDLEDELVGRCDECVPVDGWYKMTVTRAKKCIAALTEHEDYEQPETYVYADDERDKEFYGEAYDG